MHDGKPFFHKLHGRNAPILPWAEQAKSTDQMVPELDNELFVYGAFLHHITLQHLDDFVLFLMLLSRTCNEQVGLPLLHEGDI